MHAMMQIEHMNEWNEWKIKVMKKQFVFFGHLQIYLMCILDDRLQILPYPTILITLKNKSDNIFFIECDASKQANRRRKEKKDCLHCAKYR